jgi:hypothetical protein
MVLSQVSQVSRESKQTWRRRLQDRRRVNTTDLIGGSIADDSVKDDNGGSCRAHAGNYALGEWPARQYPKRTHGQAAQRGQQENERCPSAEEGATTSERTVPGDFDLSPASLTWDNASDCRDVSIFVDGHYPTRSGTTCRWYLPWCCRAAACQPDCRRERRLATSSTGRHQSRRRAPDPR